MQAKGTFDRIQFNGGEYKISIYSAHNALEFVAAKPLGTTLNVKFKGKVSNSELLIDEIQAN